MDEALILYFYTMEQYTNALIKETSPYLLQHAHNPVNWVAWSDDIFEQAKRENKLVLVSVGYSACHWCHVMEHECFEDEEVAALMNKFFINVKVDREERPDVDQVYMTAVQIMTQKGGWPLNCFTLPDGRPIYGGTYFPKEQWMHILKSLHHTFTNDHEKVVEYAEDLHEGIIASELISTTAKNVQFAETQLTELIQRWSSSFDSMQGGSSRAPKFMLPSNYSFLLDYALNSGNEKVMPHVELTLDKMALGGIYDQIGGGFSRYSVDLMWKVPHFEKMLYDNGQLLSLYAEGFKSFEKPLYKRTIYQTVEWMEREMLNDNGAFYSALDADSEGVEGKFYVWTESELEVILEDDFSWVSDLYQVSQRGFWEDGNYILLRHESDEEFMQKMDWSLDTLEANIKRINEVLLNKRSERIRPGLDDKCLTSWNAMALKGLCDAYGVFKEESFLYLALKNAKWIVENQMRPDGGLWRNHKNGTSNIEGFLEDYAHVISAFISLYEVTLDEEWLTKANALTQFSLEHFADKESSMFFFTDANTSLIARKMEVNDNVIPSSNSVMARNLFYLSKYYYNKEYEAQATQMLANVYDGMEMYGSGYSNWAILLNHMVFGFYEFVVVGGNAETKYADLLTRKLPKVLFACSKTESSLSIFQDKPIVEEALIHLCTSGTCFMPTEEVDKAIKVIQ